MTGQKMKEINHKHILEFEIDLHDFDSGMYYMEVISNNLDGNRVTKIVKR